MKTIYDLMPMYDSRKSFYGKAKVIEVENGYYLQSYNTIVCYIDKTGKNNQFCRMWSGYSVTTMRHINAFMRFSGLNLGGKKWWDCLECNKRYNISDILNMGV